MDTTNEPELKKNIVNNKSFFYSKGEASLSFTLNIEKLENMRAFISLIEEAKADIEAQIQESENQE